MKLAPHTGRLTAWIAIFAILLAAIAPSVARALSSHQQPMPWNEICSVVGTQSTHDVAPLPGSGQHDGTASNHCPFCLNHVGHFALPAAPLGKLPAVGGSAESFPTPATTQSPRFIRAAAQPRAPPVIS